MSKPQVVEDLSVWRQGFRLEHLRLAIRDFVDHYGESIRRMTAPSWNLDAKADVHPAWLSNRDLLGAAWLCEQAARACDLDGLIDWSAQLRADASQLRAAAMHEQGELLEGEA